MGANTNTDNTPPVERVRYVGISDSQLDAVIAVLETIEPHGNLALRDGLANLKDGRHEVPASEVQAGDRLHVGVVERVEPHPGGVTFHIAKATFSYHDHQPVRVERDGVVL
jgi:hypothetical protein